MRDPTAFQGLQALRGFLSAQAQPHDHKPRRRALAWAAAIAGGICAGALLSPAQGQTHQHQHPPANADPYPTECCHGQDCGPWPTEDVVPDKGGTYYIPSLAARVEAWKVKPQTPGMVAWSKQRLGEAVPYHLCVRRTPTGQLVEPIYVYCLFTSEGF